MDSLDSIRVCFYCRPETFESGELMAIHLNEAAFRIHRLGDQQGNVDQSEAIKPRFEPIIPDFR